VITREELERHNDEEGGDWVVIHGCVYNISTLAKELPCGGKRLAELVGKDASKEFDVVHSHISKEQLHQFSLGLYREVSWRGQLVWVCSVIGDEMVNLAL